MSEKAMRLMLLAALDRFNELQEQAARLGIAMELELIDGAFLCDTVRWKLVVDVRLNGDIRA